MRNKKWEVRFSKDLLDIPRDVLPMKAKMVYISFCAHADADGVAFPSIRRIAANASCCRNVVSDALKVLSDLSLIDRWQERSRNGQTVSYYRVLQPEISASAHDMDAPARDVRGVCSSGSQGGAHDRDDPHPSDVHHNNVFNIPNITAPILTAPVRTESLTEIISLWSEILVPLGVAPVRQIMETRRKLFEARVSEDVGRQTSSWWREFFGRIAASGFLISNGAGRWLTFDWALDEKHFVGIIEGKYDDRGQEQSGGSMFEELPPEEHERENERAEIFQLMFEAGFPGRADYRPDVEVAHRMGMISDELYRRAIRYIESEEARRHG